MIISRWESSHKIFCNIGASQRGQRHSEAPDVPEICIEYSTNSVLRVSGLIMCVFRCAMHVSVQLQNPTWQTTLSYT